MGGGHGHFTSIFDIFQNLKLESFQYVFNFQGVDLFTCYTIIRPLQNIY